MSDSFVPNFTSNVGANFVTAAFFLIFWWLKNKCKHSSCKSHTKLCDCSFDDYESNTETGECKVNGEETIRKAEESV